MTTQKLMATTLCTILVFLSIVSSVRAQVKPVVYIWPPKQTVEVCTDFEIEVRIRNVDVRGLKKYTLSVIYDKNKVTYIGGTFEEYPLGYLGGVGFFVVDPRGFVTATQVHWGWLQDGWSDHPGGSLFKLLFHCKAPGVSPFAFSFLAPGTSLELIDKDDVKYSFGLDFDIENAQVTQYIAEDGGFSIPVDKFGLLAPHLGVTSIILVATVAAAIYVNRIKRKKED